MKRIVILAGLVLLLAGCSAHLSATPGDEGTPPASQQETSSAAVSDPPQARSPIAPLTSNWTAEGLFLYRQDEVQLDPSAGLAGTVELYTDAEPMEDGGFAMDDRHQWRLLFRYGGECYELLPQQYLSLGGVEYRAWVDMDTGLLHLLVTVSQSASLELTEYTFYPDLFQLQPQPLVEAENINLWV